MLKRVVEYCEHFKKEPSEYSCSHHASRVDCNSNVRVFFIGMNHPMSTTFAHLQHKTVTPITTPLQSMEMAKIVQSWYAEFVEVDQTTLFELVTAANFMDIKPLLDLTCLAVSFYIKVRYCCPMSTSMQFS